MEPMDLDDDSDHHTTTPSFTPSCTQRLIYPDLLSAAYRSGALSRFSPANAVSCSTPQPSPSSSFPGQRPFCRNATFHGSPSSTFAGSRPTHRSFSRGDTLSQAALNMTTSDGESQASMEISQGSDVSDMEVVPNSPSPSPTWERVRSALSNFSLFQNESGSGQDSLFASASETGRQGWGQVAQSTDKSGTSWEPSLSAVQAAVAFRRNKEKSKSPASKVAVCNSEPLSSASSRQGEGEAESGSGSPTLREPVSANTVVSSTGWWRLCGLPVHLLSFLVLVLALALAFLLHTRIRVHRDNFANIDTELLKNEMTSKVFGQHIALDVVPTSIERYFSALHAGKGNENGNNLCFVPPLVLSFHGWTGVGKNFVSDIITTLFTARTVIRFLIPYHFPHQHLDELYESQVEHWILSNVTDYSVHFFVFDEMDKATPGVTRGIQKAIVKLGHKNSCHSPSVFLFLSNSFGAEINKAAFHGVLANQHRDSLTIHSFVHLFNKRDADLWYQQLESHITVTVPFLPLEQQHVVQCIRRDLLSKHLSTHTDLVARVLQELTFTQLASGQQFSQTGCKRVSDKVDLVALD